MQRTGDELYNPVTGMHYRILESPSDNEGRCLDLEVIYRPGSPRPPDHFHPHQSELFEIRSGEMTVRIGGETRTYGPGSSFEVPVGIPHAMWNAGEVAATVRWRTTPALRTLDLFRKLCRLAEEGRTDSNGAPGLLQSVVLASAYRNELRVTRPSPIVQRLAIALLVPVARFLGRTAT